MSSVTLRGLTKRFGDLTVLDNVSLVIEHGELVCLLGPSGCGKTTTLRLVAGFVEPTDGEIVIGDRVVSSPRRTLPPEQRNVSMVFQSYALWPHMTVAENVAYGLKLRKLDRAAIADKVKTILATTRLAPLAERYPAELSGGQQQRVSLARALIVEPETLLLDEPLSNLDANLREEMRFEVRRLHDDVSLHDDLCHARPERGDDDGRPDRGHEWGRIEQLGTPAGGLRRAALGVRGPLSGRQQHPARQGARRAARVGCRTCRLRCTGAALQTGARRRRLGPPARHRHRQRAAGQYGGNVLSATVGATSFSAATRDYLRDAKRRHPAASTTAAGVAEFASGTPCGCICRRSVSGTGRVTKQTKDDRGGHRMTIKAHSRRQVVAGSAAVLASAAISFSTTVRSQAPAAEQGHAGADRGGAGRRARSPGTPPSIYRSPSASPRPSRRSIPASPCASSARAPSASVPAHRPGVRPAASTRSTSCNSSDAAHFIVWKRDGMLAPYVPEDVAQHYPAEHKDPDGPFATWRAVAVA